MREVPWTHPLVPRTPRIPTMSSSSHLVECLVDLLKYRIFEVAGLLDRIDRFRRGGEHARVRLVKYCARARVTNRGGGVSEAERDSTRTN